MSDAESNVSLWRSVFSIQFFGWVFVFGGGFVLTVTALKAAGVGTAAAVLIGIVYGEVMDTVLDRFTDWYLASQVEPEVAA